MKRILQCLILLLLISTSFDATSQTKDAQKFRFTSTHTSFPDTARINGHNYDSVLYDATTHYNDSSVLLFVPSQFSARENVDLLFWFHGWRNNIDTADAFYELSKQFIASHRNAVLVLAETAKNSPDSYGGKLEQQGMFSLLVTDVLNELKKQKLIANQTQVGHITLAGHSGAYRVMAYILQNGKLPVNEVFLFDALYSEQPKFMNWIKENPDHVFVDLFTDEGGTIKQSNELMDQLQKENIPFAKTEETDLTVNSMKNNRILFIHTPREHNKIVNKPDNFQLFLTLKRN